MDNNEIEIELRNDNVEIEINSNPTVITNIGTNDYEKLKNQPQINTVTLLGNKTSKDLKLQDEMNRISNTELENIFSDL